MNVIVQNIYHSIIRFSDNKIEVIGNLTLLNKINNLKKQFGDHPKNWKLESFQNTVEDILLDEFIKKVKNEFVMSYSHIELCHCRMVPVDKVKNAIMEGCFTISEVSRVTMAGTGCGSCRKDIQTTIDELTKKSTL